MKFLFDTNFLLIPFTKKIDIFTELRKFSFRISFVTLSSCLDELKKVRPSLHKPVLDLVNVKKVKIVKSKGDVDNSLLRYCLKNKAVLCTLDRDLKARALKKGLSVIGIRGRRLIIEPDKILG